MKIFKSTVSSLLLTSLLTTGIVSGQTSGGFKQSKQSQQLRVNQSSSKYVVDLNELLKTGQIVSAEGFEQEVETLANALAAGERTGTIIVDRYATKRVPVVQNLAAQLLSEAVAPSLRGKRIVKIDLPSIFSDSKDNGEVSARLDAALKGIEASGGKTILFVEDISGFVKNNAVYGADVANRIRQSVMSGKVRVISASTDEEFNSQIVADAQLNTRFQKVDLDRVGELANDETLANKLSPDLLELMASGNPN